MATEYYQGYDTYVIYGEETSYGAGASPSSLKIGKVTNFSLSMNNNMFKTQSMGDGRNATVSVTGPFDVSGSMDFQVDDFTFMKYAVGKSQGAGTVGDPYELVECDNIGYDAGNIKSVTLEVGSEGDSNDDVTQITGVVINSLSINANQGEVITSSIDFIGKTVATSTTLESYTASSNKPFVFHDANVVVGSDNCHCTAFSLTLNNNVQTYRNLNSRFIEQPTMGLRRYDFSVTLKKKYDSTASVLSATELRDLFFGASNAPTAANTITAQSLSLDITEGGSSGDRVVNIDLENCYFNEWSEPIPLEGGVIEVTVNGYGHAGLSDGTDKVPIRWYTIA